MQCFEDRFNDGIQVRKYIGVPESNDAKACGPKKVVSLVVVGGALRVLAAIQLDDDPSID